MHGWCLKGIILYRHTRHTSHMCICPPQDTPQVKCPCIVQSIHYTYHNHNIYYMCISHVSHTILMHSTYQHTTHAHMTHIRHVNSTTYVTYNMHAHTAHVPYTHEPHNIQHILHHTYTHHKPYTHTIHMAHTHIYIITKHINHIFTPHIHTTHR